MPEIIKQWNLPKGAKVKVDNRVITFVKMDGMYGQWTDEKGDIQIGCFRHGFVKNGDFYDYITDDKISNN